MLGAKDYRGMPYIAENFERKPLQHFSWICSGLKIPDFLHIVPAFCMQRQKIAEAEAKCVNWDLSVSDFKVS